MQLEIQKPDEEKIEYKCQKVSGISIGSYFFDPLDNKHYLMLEPKIYDPPTVKVMDLLTNSIEALSHDFEVPCHSIWGPSEIKLVVQEKKPEKQEQENEKPS